jgi:membrane protein implicated in regulation of membrane protease activity
LREWSIENRKETYLMGDYVMTIVWAAIFLAAIWIEAETAEMVAMWFMPGAIASLVLTFFNIDWWVQCIVFIVLSAALLILAKTVLKKYIVKHVGTEKTDTDLLIGKTAVVTERIDNAEMTGAVKVDGKVWSARMSDSCETAEVGEFVEVLSISGVKLICKWK